MSKGHVNLLTGGRPQDESYPSWNRPKLSLYVSVCASEDGSCKGGANLGLECTVTFAIYKCGLCSPLFYNGSYVLHFSPIIMEGQSKMEGYLPSYNGLSTVNKEREIIK